MSTSRRSSGTRPHKLVAVRVYGAFSNAFATPWIVSIP
jgi:hypothetical protein